MEKVDQDARESSSKVKGTPFPQLEVAYNGAADTRGIVDHHTTVESREDTLLY